MLAERPAPPSRTSWSLAARAQLLPGLAAVVVFLAWGQASGGYLPHVWYAGGIVLVGILAVVLAACPALLGGLGRATILVFRLTRRGWLPVVRLRTDAAGNFGASKARLGLGGSARLRVVARYGGVLTAITVRSPVLVVRRQL